MYKHKRIIMGYDTKKQQWGGYKIIEYSKMPDGTGARKRTLHKDLTSDNAEELVYKLEKNIKK